MRFGDFRRTAIETSDHAPMALYQRLNFSRLGISDRINFLAG